MSNRCIGDADTADIEPDIIADLGTGKLYLAGCPVALDRFCGSILSSRLVGCLGDKRNNDE